MPFFIYSAVSAQGGMTRGSGRYDDVEALYRALAARGDELYRYLALPEALGQLARPFHGQPRTVELAELCRRLSLYLGSGLDIQAAIDDMAASARRPPLKRILNAMRRYLVQGYRPSEAMRMAGGIPDFVVNMARIGEDSGELAQTLADAARHLDRIHAIKAAAKRGLIYPALTLAALLAGIAFWMLFVVPRMVALFQSIQTPLPAPTRWLIGLSEGLATYWPLLAALVLLAPFAVVVGLRRSPALRLAADRLLWRSPIIGEPLRAVQSAFFFQYLALLYGAGVPITRALELVIASIGNRWLRQGAAAVQTALRDGNTLAMSFARPELFAPEVPRMLGAGEQTGQLQKQLHRLAEVHFQRIETLVDAVDKLLEPLIIALVASLFGFFALALFSPLYDLIGGIGAVR